MKSRLSSTTTPLRTTVTFALLALAGHAGAVSSGSTDLWGNSFRQSFGAASNQPIGQTAYTNGSTDIWANGFKVSFGAGEGSSKQAAADAVGSTDIWGNNIARSFAGRSNPASAQSAGIDQAAVGSN